VCSTFSRIYSGLKYDFLKLMEKSTCVEWSLVANNYEWGGVGTIINNQERILL
jgi:hypothetical protein